MLEKESLISDSFVDVDQCNVTISHQPENENAMYDICSMEGRILITGRLNKLQTNIDLEGYPRGGYNVFILDGDQVYKNSFRL